MDFTFTDEQQAVRDLAAQILGDHSAPDALRTLERSGEPRFDSALWGTLADAGLLGIGVPEADGGAGLGLIEAACVIEAAGKVAGAVPVWETLGLGVPALLAADTDAAHAWLARVAGGDAVLTAAWHQGDGLGTTPSITLDASGAVTGSAVCVPAAMVADAIVVPAVDGDDVAIVLVETGAAGVTRDPIETTMGTPDGNVTFDGAPSLPLAVGSAAVAAAFDRAAATQCALALGNCVGALELLARYTTDRHQFGVPIASFQAVGHRAADAYIDTEAVRLTTWQAIWRLDEGLAAGEEVAVAKYWAAYGGQRVVHAAVHLHGGVGVDRDYPLHRFFLAAKQIELQLGGATPSLLRLGRSIAANA